MTKPYEPRILGGRLGFLVGFLILWGVLHGTAGLDPTAQWGLGVLAAVLATAVAVESVLRQRKPTDALAQLGLGRPTGRAILAASVVSALILLVYPAWAMVTGTAVRLNPDWIWRLFGVFALHGVAEELVWRGYAFRSLREGRSFRAAVLWTMPLIALTHIPIALTLGPAIGLGAMTVAAVTSLPLSYLYEVGRRTIWAPALIHTAIDSFKLVAIPAGTATTLSLLLIVVSIVVPLLALAVPRHWFRAQIPQVRDQTPLAHTE